MRTKKSSSRGGILSLEVVKAHAAFRQHLGDDILIERALVNTGFLLTRRSSWASSSSIRSRAEKISTAELRV